MSWSQPQGFRFPSTVGLPMMSRALEKYAWPTWRSEAVRALAMVADELLAADGDGDAVLHRLSYGQVGEADLVLSRAQGGGVLLRAAEFLDVAHAVMHRPSAVPLPASLDLRCTCQFMDDPGDPESAWVYVLLGAERTSMEMMFGSLRDVRPYPVPTGVELTSEEEERAAVWRRVLARYTGFSPPSIVAPEPHLAFDLMESLGSEEFGALEVQGKLTVSEVVEAVALRRGEADSSRLRELLVAPIES